MGGRSAEGSGDQGSEAVEVIDLRLVVKAGFKGVFLEEVLHVEDDVYGYTELLNDGFGHLLPRGLAEVFLDSPQAEEVQRILETGEVARKR